MKFNISKNIQSIYESVSSLENLETKTKIDTMLESINPIPSNILSAMIKEAANPKNLRIVANSDDGLNLYVEATEFMNFCEAGNFVSIKEAVDYIKESYESELPEVGSAVFHVVVPHNNFSKDIIGGENLGESVKMDWPMQLLTGCSRYGIMIDFVGTDI